MNAEFRLHKETLLLCVLLYVVVGSAEKQFSKLWALLNNSFLN